MLWRLNIHSLLGIPSCYWIWCSCSLMAHNGKMAETDEMSWWTLHSCRFLTPVTVFFSRVMLSTCWRPSFVILTGTLVRWCSCEPNLYAIGIYRLLHLGYWVNLFDLTDKHSMHSNIFRNSTACVSLLVWNFHQYRWTTSRQLFIR